MKLPEIRAMLFEFVVDDPREVALVKNEGLVLLKEGTSVFDEQWSPLYSEFANKLCGLTPEQSYNVYTAMGEKLGNENELDLYHALTVPEEGGQNIRRQKWLRRMILRDLGITHEQSSFASD